MFIGLCIYILKKLIKHKKVKKIENWRDLPFIGNNNPATYHKQVNNNFSQKNLPIYYPISTPLEDNYFNYLNSISSSKLSMLRNIIDKVIIYSNQNIKPIIFNYAEQPIEIKQADPRTIKILVDTVINLINNLGKQYLRLEYISTSNEIHEETETHSRIVFDIKVKFFYADYEQLGKKIDPDIIFIQPEFLFEKIYKVLPEDNFFNPKKILNYNSYMSNLIIIGSENFGFLSGKFNKIKYERN
jgi:hypothetical protein